MVERLNGLKAILFRLPGFTKISSLSKFAILLICFSWWYGAFKYEVFKKNHVITDVVSYYAYLPSAFIYHDLSLQYTDADKAFFDYKIRPVKAPNGARIVKTSMGLSLMYAPFFGIGHLLAPHFGYHRDGFSAPYQVSIVVGVFIYLLIGFIFLRKVLLRYFSEGVTFITLLGLFLGTNLFYYSVIIPMMAHSFLFALGCIFMYYTIVFHEKATLKRAILLGFIAGLMTLIRPTMIFLLLFPVLYNVYSWNTLKEKIIFIGQNKKLLFPFALFFMLPIIPQLIYWKHYTGDWMFFSYVGERFFFDNPHIYEGLFGYRKGWLLYTPIMFFSVAGLLLLIAYRKEFFLAILIPVAILIYALLSWWSWWYGGSFGQRVFIDFYPLLALPFACFFQFILNRKIRIQDFTFFITGVLVFWNLFQTWEFNEGLLHYDSMTKESYWRGFFQTMSNTQYWQSLKQPNGYAAFRGLNESVIMQEGYEPETTEQDAKQHLSTVLHHSGKTSFALNDSCPYTPGIIFSLGDLLDMKAGILRASAYVYMPKEFRTEDRDKSYIILSMEAPDGKLVYYRGDQLFDKCIKGKWTQVSFDMPIGGDTPRDYRAKVYLSNMGKEKIYVDDVQIDIYP
jgi:hypothetical protein